VKSNKFYLFTTNILKLLCRDVVFSFHESDNGGHIEHTYVSLTVYTIKSLLLQTLCWNIFRSTVRLS